MCHNKWNNVCLQSFRKVHSSLGLLSFLMHFLHIDFSRKSSHRSDTQKCICTTRNCLSDFLHKLWETNRISAITFQLWNVLLKSDCNFSCIELFVLPYCYHMRCFFFFCSSAILWIAKCWTVFLSPNPWPVHFKTEKKLLQCSNFTLDFRLGAL